MAGALAEALALFERAVELPAAAQRALLDRACADDPALRQEVEKMLAADARTSALDTGEAGGLTALAGALSALGRPRRLGDFEIHGELGRGGMGVVYEAQQREPDRRVALKTLNLVGEAARARLRAEVQAMARLLHVGIPQVYEVFDDGERPVLVMELVRGAALGEAAAGLGLCERVALLIRVAEAIEHAHARGVIHRDLKPANILVTETGQPKVLDFGIASLGGGAQVDAGTPLYMPPEQLRGEATDARADVYALAVVAWELLAGAPPIVGAGDREALLAAKERGPAGDGGLPAGLAASLRLGLAADPEARPSSVAELRAAWRRFLDEDAARQVLASAEAELVALDGDIDEEELERRAAAARFGLEQALRLTPGDVEVRRRRDRAQCRLAAWRIARGEIELADHLLADVDAPPAELVARLADARRARAGPVAGMVFGAGLLFTAAALVVGAFAASGRSPGYGLFALSSVVMIGVGAAIIGGLRRLGVRRTQARPGLLLVVPLMMLFVDLGAWLRGWPAERSHALILPLVGVVALLLTVAADRRYGVLAALSVGAWIASASAPLAIYWILAVNAGLSALVSFAFALRLRAAERGREAAARSTSSVGGASRT